MEKRIQNLRRISRIEKLITTKNKNNLFSAFTYLKVNVIKYKQKLAKDK